MVVELRRLIGLSLWFVAACATAPYVPCPVESNVPLPADAFAVCRRVLGQRFGGVAVADETSFLLQSGWAPTDEPPGERRASVFLERGELVVVVEARWLAESVVGMPSWTLVRGDAVAERELAEVLRAELGRSADAAADVAKPTW